MTDESQTNGLPKEFEKFADRIKVREAVVGRSVVRFFRNDSEADSTEDASEDEE